MTAFSAARAAAVPKGSKVVCSSESSTRTARFTHFVRGPGSIHAYLQGRWRGIGHNPLGALGVLALLGLFGFQAVSGLFTNDDIAFSGPLLDALALVLPRLDNAPRSEWLLYGVPAGAELTAGYFDLGGRLEAMFRGDHINVTEDRAVLHTALRQPDGARVDVAVLSMGNPHAVFWVDDVDAHDLVAGDEGALYVARAMNGIEVSGQRQ